MAFMDRVISREKYGSQDVKRTYITTATGGLVVVDQSKRWTSISQFFRSVFLPQGYPESVSGDYLHYQIWDTIQAFASSITGTLATQAVLKGVGVGDQSATVLAATMTWLIKDGTGMFGRIMFTWVQGVYLDCDCKRWRLFADILNDFAIFLEILAPIFKKHFMLLVCIAGVSKSIVGVAGGATRAALTQHQARRDNMADVSAKDGSQETLVNLAALVVGLVLIPLVTGKQTLIWVLFVLFTMLHLFANYRAVTGVCMEWLNQARLHLIIHHYLDSPDSAILPVKVVNAQEPVFWRTRRILYINLGTTLDYLAKRHEDLHKLLNLYRNQNYLLNVELGPGWTHIVLHEDSDHMDQLRACFQAEVLEYAVKAARSAKYKVTSSTSLAMQNMVEAAKHNDHWSLLAHSVSFTEEHLPNFLKQIESKGWKTSRVSLCADEWRSVWDLDDAMKSHAKHL